MVGNDAQSNVQQVIDPVNPADVGDAGTFRTILFTKNPNLEPEESDNYNLGFSWSPELPWGGGDHQFQVDLDYFHFKFKKQIRADDPAQVVGSDPCGPQVVRDPLNFIVAPLPPPPGATPCPSPVGEILVVQAGFFNSGKTKEDDAFGLRVGSKGLFGQIDSHTEVDVQYAYEFGASRQYSITLGAINVFDEEPPDTFFRGYAEELHNPFMRQVYVRAGASF